MPQSPSLYRELTVDEHVTMARTLRSGFDTALARRRLDDLDIPLDAHAGALSGGQQAQVGLALALGARAPVLLLDKPLASLDPLARREFLHVLVDAVRADGATALRLPDGSLVGWEYLGFDGNGPYDDQGISRYPEVTMVVPGTRFQEVQAREAIALAGGSLVALALAGLVVQRRRPD